MLDEHDDRGAGRGAVPLPACAHDYFVPPYVGYRGWLGVRLDRGIDDDELAGVIEDAWLAVAPARLIAASGLGVTRPG